MSSLLLSLVRESIGLLLRDHSSRLALRYGIGTVTLYAVITMLGLITIIFFYWALYLAIAKALGEEETAAILCGGTLIAIVLILAGRLLVRRIRRGSAADYSNDLAGTTFSELRAVLALGRHFEKDIRKATPEIAIVSAVIGLIVGTHPEILDLLFRPRARSSSFPPSSDGESR